MQKFHFTAINAPPIAAIPTGATLAVNPEHLQVLKQAQAWLIGLIGP